MMSFIQLLLLLRRLPFRDLLSYPKNLEDAEGVRKWLIAVTEAGGVLADLTDTSIDDEIFNALGEVLADKEAFNIIHDLVLALFAQTTDEKTIKFKDGCEEVANRTGFSPALIIAIIQVVIMLLKFIRERRSN